MTHGVKRLKVGILFSYEPHHEKTCLRQCEQVRVKLLKLPRVYISATAAKTLSLFLKWPLNNDHGVSHIIVHSYICIFGKYETELHPTTQFRHQKPPITNNW